MEQEFYRDEFEQLLKDTTDDFKMYPSRKVWHSIYNDLHPDRKWPSFAVCLLLLTTILYIGVTNNNAISSNSKRNTAFNERYTQAAEENNSQPAGRHTAAANTNLPQNEIIDLAMDIDFADQVQPTVFPVLAGNDNAQETPVEAGNAPAGDDAAATTAKLQENTTHNSSFENSTTFTTGGSTRLSVTPAAAESDDIAGNDKTAATNDANTKTADADAAIDAEKQEDARKELNSLLAGNTNKTLTKDTREREWIEDFAFYNKSNAGKNLLKGLSTQFYVTPSIGYRVMFRNNDYKGDNALVTNNAARNSEDKVELNQQAAINMEAGWGITKDLNKRLRFKTGLQFNYTDYLTYAQKLDHPTQTTLVVDGQGAGISMEAYSSDYAHIPGKNTSKLHNNTIQLSIPLGMDYKLLSNRVLNWYIGATVQPTLVTRSHSYLLSSDNNYFVQDQDMFRRWNLNGAIESFVSFKTPSGTFINIGPQFRYQLFSSYSKAYTFTEKPYSVGFKIGFTRPL